ncbi:UNVERIFIED_CONTAM: lysine decarboxylase family protein [Hammondia hammondi]|eukprot:XP_008888223.1 lysine decarboxylase family protein [Hammondia hammondi]
MSSTAPPEGNSQSTNGNSNTTDVAKDVTATKKSYANNAWLQTAPARQVRMLCEYLEARDRLRQQRILATFLVFGTARSLTHDQWNSRMNEATARLRLLKNDRNESEGASVSDPEAVLAVEREIGDLRRLEWLCLFSEKVTKLTRRLAEWLMTAEARAAGKRILQKFPTPLDNDEYWGPDQGSMSQQLVYCPVAICTGGGPGLMEAANKGASEAPGARTIGMGITLPFEAGLNRYVTKDLGFEFQYLFARKFWMINTALGVIAAPGGFGTLDELMEVLALKQSNKLKRDMPIVLLGKTYWTSVISFDKMVEFGTISQSDCDKLFITDDEDEAFEYLRSFLLKDSAVTGEGYIHKSLAKRQRE